MAAASAPAFPPRVDDELDFDPLTGRLRLGTLDTDLPPGSDNLQVLDAYVELVGRRRGQRPQALVEVRTNDVDTLSVLLDLDTDDLSELLQQILGTSPEQADRLVTRLRARRSVLGFAAAAAGVVLAGGIALGVAGTRGDRGAATSKSATDRPPAATAPATEPAEDPGATGATGTTEAPTPRPPPAATPASRKAATRSRRMGCPASSVSNRPHSPVSHSRLPCLPNRRWRCRRRSPPPTTV